MNNELFKIDFNKDDGTINSIKIVGDGHNMNWCVEGGRWGYVHSINYDNLWGDYKSRMKEMRLIEFYEDEQCAVSVYTNDILQVTVKRLFDCDGNLVERFIFKNLVYADAFLSEYNCGIEVPFNDKYTDADDCLVHRCNTHIWCGIDSTYINALRMGVSDSNLGLVVTKGAFGDYSLLNNIGNSRGRFILNLSSIELMQDEQYMIEWVIFVHKGKEDVIKKALNYPQFIYIDAEHHTLFRGEKIRFSARGYQSAENVRVYDNDGEIEYKIKNGIVEVECDAEQNGERRIFVEINGVRTYADFLVKDIFEEILRKRIDFIVDKQQYNKSGSPLDGAFLIYDNKEEHMIFEDCIADHNAGRERLGMGLLIARYLQTHENKKFYDAIIKYIAFIKREIYDSDTGYVYNTVGKDESQVRLYNAPWVSMLFTEMYHLTGDKEYLKDVAKLFDVYYSIGGNKFYPNAVSILKTANAFKSAGMEENYKKMYSMFERHVSNMVANGTSYPKHEVNYEQTIVSPAATFISEFAALSGDEKYIDEAKKHIEVLERFNGSQPSFHLKEIPIRYWDDYWFGKMQLVGDTFPHYWSCLTARSYNDYYKISGDERYREAAEECMRNCLCLFTDDGRGSAAYMYPYRINDAYGKVYDEWANDQDFALYFALETGILS